MPSLSWRQRLGALAIASSLAVAGAGEISSWWRVGLARAADSVVLENVTVEFEGSIYRIPRAEVAGTTLSRAELLALFEGASPEPWAARLRRLSATTIAIPELTVEQRIGPNRQVNTYRGVVAEGITQGRIGKATAAGGAIEITGDPLGAQSGGFGRVALEGIDLAEAARVFSERAGPDAPKTAIYGAFSLESLSLNTPEGGGITIARMAASDARVRPLRESWADALNALSQDHGAQPQTPEQRSRLFGSLAELLDAFSLGSLEFTGLAVKPPASKDTGRVSIARAAYSGAGPDRRPDLRFEGIEVAGPGTVARLQSLAFTGFSLASSIEGLRALAAKSGAAIDQADLRRLLPGIGTIRLAGLDFAGGEPNASPPDASPVRFGIRGIELTADRPVGGIPSDVRFGLEGLSLAIPPNPSQDGLKDLLAMGYQALDLSSLVVTTWNEAASELAIGEISLSGKDMGRATIRGALGNITKDVFDPDTAVALVALVGATAKNLELTVSNEGLFERALANQARKRGQSPDELRRELGVAAAVAIPPFLGNSPAAKAIGQAVARFVAKPGRLSITARAKDAEGLGIADMSSLGDPAAVLERLEVTATAE